MKTTSATGYTLEPRPDGGGVFHSGLLEGGFGGGPAFVDALIESTLPK